MLPPLWYWAGVRDKNPMRYTGACSGALGSRLWPAISEAEYLLARIWLRTSNRCIPPIPTGRRRTTSIPRSHRSSPLPRVRKWWGSPVLLTSDEMETISNELFVGNKLTSGALHTPDGIRVDLRNISRRSSCSVPGATIHTTAASAGLDSRSLETEREIVAAGQTIVYCLHQSVGHLGISCPGRSPNKELGSLPSAWT